MGNTQQLYGRLDMVMLDRQDKIYGSLGMHDSYLLNTVTGNPLTLTHSREGKMDDEVTDCKIFGWSKQKSTTGAQLLDLRESDIRKDSGLTVTLGEDGTITVDGTPKAAYIQVVTKKIHLEPGIYYTSGGKKEAGYIYSQMNIKGSDGTWNYLSNTPIYIDGSEQEIQYVIQTLNTGAAIKNYTIYPMLNVGAKALSWEPYTGGQPSPSPEYPQEIVSAGSDGKIRIEVRGKNLFDFSCLESDGVNVMDYDKQTITVPAKTNNTGYNQTLRDLCPSITPGTYVLSMKRSNQESISGSYFLEISKDFPVNTPIELTDAHLDSHISWYNNPDSEIENVISEIQLEAGDTVTAYEPYHEPQSLTIQTPNGLPGIPVGTGGNYTDADGQQWIADYIDLKRGKYVQRVWQKTFDGSESMGIYDNTRGFFIRNVLPNNYYKRKGFMNQQKVFFIGLGNKYLYINESEFYDEGLTDKGLSNWKAHLAEHPLVVMTYLDEPIERDLTPSEIQIYQNLVTYAGTTIVENDQDCYMEVTYKASGNE